MGHYLFNFAKKGAAKGRTLREQAAELIEVEMWGIGAKAPNRTSLAPGDHILIYVGAPEYEFIGHAELGSAAHEWSSEEMGDTRVASTVVSSSARPRPGRTRFR